VSGRVKKASPNTRKGCEENEIPENSTPEGFKKASTEDECKRMKKKERLGRLQRKPSG